MNKKIKRMMKEIERRGGAITMSTKLPEDIAESFFTQILDCPDCRAKVRGNGVDLADEPPLGKPGQHKASDH